MKRDVRKALSAFKREDKDAIPDADWSEIEDLCNSNMWNEDYVLGFVAGYLAALSAPPAPARESKKARRKR